MNAINRKGFLRVSFVREKRNSSLISYGYKLFVFVFFNGNKLFVLIFNKLILLLNLILILLFIFNFIVICIILNVFL
jgi:hypothetical protein